MVNGEWSSLYLRDLLISSFALLARAGLMTVPQTGTVMRPARAPPNY